jgi:hypothetical protein
MPDNVNITVNETIENVVINPSISTDVIDFNITSTTENVTIDVTPNLTTVNINSISGSPVTKTSDLTNDGEDGIHPFITLEDIPPVTGYVPYTGATQDVNLGEFGLQTGNIEFDLTPTNAPTGVGSMFWNDTAGTLDLKLKGGAVTLQIGQETVARVVNKTTTNITLLEANYQIVRVTGAQGQRPKVDLALANNDLNSTTTLGLVTETIANNQEGFITTSGQVQQINTTGSLQGETWADGDVLYLSGTIAGQATNIKPAAPIHTVIIGFVEYAHITQGKIFVKVDNGYELEELHNVSAIAPNNNEVLTYDTPTLLWKPKTVISALGYTPFQLPALTSGSVLFSNGTTIAQDNSNFFWDDTNNRLGINNNVPFTGLTSVYGLDIGDNLSANYGNLNVRGYSSLGGFSTSSYGGVGSNYCLNSTGNIIRRFNDRVSLIDFAAGGFVFKTSGTGAVGSSISLTELMRLNTNGNLLINTTTDNGGKLQIKAPGALSTDIALRVRNSADTGDLMTVNGLGFITGNNTIQTTAGGMQVFGNSSNWGTTNATALQFVTVGSNAYLTSINNSNSAFQNLILRFSNLTFASAGGNFNSQFFSNGNLVINSTTDNGGKLQIKAPGALSTDIALRVRNSADTGDLMLINGLGSLLLGTSTNIASSKLTVESTTQGFLPPRMTNAQRLLIATPAVGLCVYCTDVVEGLYINKSTGWTYIG